MTRRTTGRKTKPAAGTAAVLALTATLLLSACGGTGSTTNTSGLGSSSLTTGTSDVALGKVIFLTGADQNGRAIPRSGGIGMMGSGGCITCHGPDGKGGTISMMGTYQVPDIRWSTLSQPMKSSEGGTEPPYDPTTFARAVRDGIGSDGDHLESVMPRWQLTDPQVDGLIAYLKTL